MSDSFNQKIQIFKEMLISFNRYVNVTSKKSLHLLDVHIQDSMHLAEQVSTSHVHVDMGSGAGIPGIIVAIMTNASVICIESKKKKRDFLESVRQELQLSNVLVYDSDVQSFAKRYCGQKITSFSAKAFAKPPQLLNYLSHFKKNQFDSNAICWVPISKDQADILAKFDDVIEVGMRPFYYFKIQMRSFRLYKADLKNKYNL